MALSEYDVPPWDITSDGTKSFRSYLEGYWQFQGTKCLDGIERPQANPPLSQLLLHNRVHLYVAGKFKCKGLEKEAVGTMNPATAPNDPVFWLHHAFVDKLWVDWSTRHGKAYEPAAGPTGRLSLNDKIKPFADIVVQPDTPAEIAHH